MSVAERKFSRNRNSCGLQDEQEPEFDHNNLHKVSTPNYGPVAAIFNLCSEDPARFIELVSFLSPVTQDILIQYYLLGRTYEQIGMLLFPDNTFWTQVEYVKWGNEIGIKALGAVIAFGGRPTEGQLRRRPNLAEPFRRMLAFKTDLDSRVVKMKSPPSFGKFSVTPNGDLGELFPPSWSAMRARGSGDRC